MPFDPNIPQANTEIDAVQMRGQLTSLKALIDSIQNITAAQADGTNTLPPGSAANVNLSVIGDTLHFSFDIPRGDEGLPGLQGPSFAQAIVDAVNTLNPGDPATVSVGFDGSNVRFTFGIPRGNDGGQGPPGNDGQPGPTGGTGPQGPPFAQAVVDGMNTVSPGSPAAVTVSFDGTNVHFAFDIPQGLTGDTGATGVPGEVSNADLQNAVTTLTNDTSANTNAVATLNTPFVNDPPTLAYMEVMRAKINEFILAARR